MLLQRPPGGLRTREEVCTLRDLPPVARVSLKADGALSAEMAATAFAELLRTGDLGAGAAAAAGAGEKMCDSLRLAWQAEILCEVADADSSLKKMLDLPPGGASTRDEFLQPLAWGMPEKSWTLMVAGRIGELGVGAGWKMSDGQCSARTCKESREGGM
jgi:hypothetical protein